MAGELFNSLWMSVMDVCRMLFARRRRKSYVGRGAGELGICRLRRGIIQKTKNSTVWSQAEVGIVPAPEPVWQG